MRNRNWLLCLIWVLSLNTQAQKNGLAWSEGLNWDQIKAKAKVENKYIFLDCFTTWCGPCKEMEPIYANDTIGSAFNNRLVSVKVQMDRSKGDNEYIRNWYGQADSLAKKYRITAYPSFIFLSPEGNLVYKEIGFKPVDQFIQMVRKALDPDQVYTDPYAEYDHLVENYRRHIVDYSKMPYIVNTAAQLGDTNIAKEVFRDYVKHFSDFKDSSIYTRENISFIASHISSRSKLFLLFYPDSRKVNEVMKRKDYAESIVDTVIQKEIIFPFLNIDPGELRKIPPDLREANWQTLYNKIKTRYNDEYATRNTIEGRIAWYFYYNNFSRCAAYYLKRLEKYGTDTTNEMADVYINFYAWEVFFKHISNKDENIRMIKWMEGVINRTPHQVYIDTYSNLLYKVGRRKEALILEKKAVKLAIKDQYEPDIAEFKARLTKMKKGVPTW